MSERSSSSRKREKEVKWRQVFHNRPYNPRLFFSFSPLHHQRSTESSENQTKNSHLLVTSFFFTFFCQPLFQSPYPLNLICPTKLHPYPFMPALSSWSPLWALPVAAGPPGFVVYNCIKRLLLWADLTAFPLVHAAWPSWQTIPVWTDLKLPSFVVFYRLSHFNF